MTRARLFDGVDDLLGELVLGTRNLELLDARTRAYVDFAYTRAHNILRAEGDDYARRVLETRLRLAMHLSPISAINYDRANPTPRWRLVQDFIVRWLGRDFQTSEPLAREVAGVLDAWDSARVGVTSHRTALMKRDGPYCANCRVRLDGVAVPFSLSSLDAYKPYFESPEELLLAEVDHIEAVSGIGTNRIENLQLLCRLCNAGKGDGLGPDLRSEALYAGIRIPDVPRAHRARMMYYVIARDGRSCTQCGDTLAELTVRPVIREGAFIRSNLTTVCFSCLN